MEPNGSNPECPAASYQTYGATMFMSGKHFQVDAYFSGAQAKPKNAEGSV
jgi:hypothetical protein